MLVQSCRQYTILVYSRWPTARPLTRLTDHATHNTTARAPRAAAELVRWFSIHVGPNSAAGENGCAPCVLGRPYLIKGCGQYPSWDFLKILGKGRSFFGS